MSSHARRRRRQNGTVITVGMDCPAGSNYCSLDLATASGLGINRNRVHLDFQERSEGDHDFQQAIYNHRQSGGSEDTKAALLSIGRPIGDGLLKDALLQAGMNPNQYTFNFVFSEVSTGEGGRGGGRNDTSRAAARTQAQLPQASITYPRYSQSAHSWDRTTAGSSNHPTAGYDSSQNQQQDWDGPEEVEADAADEGQETQVEQYSSDWYKTENGEWRNSSYAGYQSPHGDV